MEQERQGHLLVALALGIGFAVLAALAGKATGLSLFNEGAEAEITAQLVAEAKRKAQPCDATVAQFGPGERWLRHHHIYECVRFARGLPVDVMTHPLAAK